MSNAGGGGRDWSIFIPSDHMHSKRHSEDNEEGEEVKKQIKYDDDDADADVVNERNVHAYKRRRPGPEAGHEREMVVMTMTTTTKKNRQEDDDDEEEKPLLSNPTSAAYSIRDEENTLNQLPSDAFSKIQREPDSSSSFPVLNHQDSSKKKDRNGSSKNAAVISTVHGHHESAFDPLLDSLKDLPAPVIGSPPKKERLQSLDVFRGLTVVAMVLVDYGGGLWGALDHSPWDGVTFADFVFPAFLFMVGLSLALACKLVDDKRSALVMVLLRFLKLFGLGLLLQGGYLHGIKNLGFGVDLQSLRIMGILQRIGIAYVIVALCEVCRSSKHIPQPNENFFGIVKIYYVQWVAALVIAVIYTGILYGIYVPDWQFEDPMSLSLEGSKNISMVKCNVRGSLNPGCNAVSFIDRSVLGISHLYQRPPYHRVKECNDNSPSPSWCSAPFDPEGLLSTLPAILTCFIGAHYGHVLLHVKGHKRQLLQWIVFGLVFTMMGLVFDSIGIPLNKQLYSLSYMLLTGGVVALAFTAVFVLVDVYKWRSSMIVFKWIGAHALMVYALFACDVLPIALHGIYWKSPENNVIHIILKGLGVI